MQFSKSSASYWSIYRVLILYYFAATCLFIAHPTCCIVALSVALLVVVVAVYHLCPTVLFIKVIIENNTIICKILYLIAQ